MITNENEPPGFITFLSQGAAVGALLNFPTLVKGLLVNDPYYGALFLAALPEYLAIGVAFGVLEAIIIWACTYVVGHRINVILRAGIALTVLALLFVLVYLIYYEPSPYERKVSQTEYLVNIGTYIVCGVIFGLVIGSRFKPLAELARGTSPPRWPVITAITGFILRFAVILFLMYSILAFVWIVTANSTRKEFTFAVITLSHFVAALIIIFVRMPFWLLLPLAVIVNFPVVTLITDVLAPEEVATWYVAIVYLHLWAAFMLCRVSVPRCLLSKESE